MSIRPTSRRTPLGGAIAFVVTCFTIMAIGAFAAASPPPAPPGLTDAAPPERIEQAIAEGRLGVPELSALVDGLVARRVQAQEKDEIAALDRVLWLIHECGAMPMEHAAHWMRDRFDRVARTGDVKPVPFGERLTFPVTFEPPRIDAFLWSVASGAAERRGESWPESKRLFFGPIIPERWEVNGRAIPPHAGYGAMGGQIDPTDAVRTFGFPAPFDLPPGRHTIALTVDFWVCDRSSLSPPDPENPWPRERWSRRFETTVTVLPPDANAPSERSVWVGEDSQLRRYLLRVPRGGDIQHPLPLVVAFHGGGGDPASMMRFSGLNATADRHGFLLAYPFGSGTMRDRQLSFNAGDCCGHAVEIGADDVAFVGAMLDDIATIVSVDATRVYATGMSNGAMMAYRVAAELADRFAAIAPVGGPMGLDRCAPSRPVAVIHFHGTADEHAPYDGGEGVGHPLTSDRPTFRSVERSLGMWIDANGCDRDGVDTVIADGASDDLRVVRSTWGNGRDGTEVVLIRVEGGGHTWPGRQPPLRALGRSTTAISASELMWEFFTRHARRAPDGDEAATGP